MLVVKIIIHFIGINTGLHARHIGCTDRGKFLAVRHIERTLGQKTLQFHQIVISGRPAVDTQAFHRMSGYFLHHFNDVRDLLCDTVNRCFYNLTPAGGPGHIHDCRPYLRIPVRRGKSRKGRHQNCLISRVGPCDQIFRLTRGRDQLQVIFQPGDHSPGVVDISLQAVECPAVHLIRNGGRQSRIRDHLVSDIHHDRRTGAVRGLDHAFRAAVLPEQSRM